MKKKKSSTGKCNVKKNYEDHQLAYNIYPFSGPHGQGAAGVSPPPRRLVGFTTLLGVLPVHALHNGTGSVCGEHQWLHCV